MIRPGARSSLRAGGSESRAARGACARPGPHLARGAAAPPRPGRPRLHRPRGLPRLRHLSRLERRHGRERLRDGALLRGGSGGDRRPGRARARRHRPDPAPVPALARARWRSGVVAIVCGLLLALAAQTAGLGPDGVRKGLFDPTSSPTTAAASGRSSTGPRPRSSSGSARTSSRWCWWSPGLLLVSGRSVSDMVRAGRRGRGAGQARHGRLRHRRQGEPGPHRPGPDRHRRPATPSRSSARPSRSRADDDYQVLVRRAEEQETSLGRQLRRGGARRRRARHERARGPRGGRETIRVAKAREAGAGVARGRAESTSRARAST